MWCCFILCLCAHVCVCLCIVYGCHGGGPHYLARSHTDMATVRWGQLVDLFLFPQLFNELVMGRTAQLPRQQGWTPTSEVGNLYILGSQAYANGLPLLPPPPFFFSARMSFLFHPGLDMCANSALALKGGGGGGGGWLVAGTSISDGWDDRGSHFGSDSAYDPPPSRTAWVAGKWIINRKCVLTMIRHTFLACIFWLFFVFILSV